MKEDGVSSFLSVPAKRKNLRAPHTQVSKLFFHDQEAGVLSSEGPDCVFRTSRISLDDAPQPVMRDLSILLKIPSSSH